MKKSKKGIPKGYYCYTHKNGRQVNCPYWGIDKIPGRDSQENGYCSYLEKSDWDINDEKKDIEIQSHDPNTKEDRSEIYRNTSDHELGLTSGLLWDQCKECDVRRGLGFWRELLLFIK